MDRSGIVERPSAAILALFLFLPACTDATTVSGEGPDAVSGSQQCSIPQHKILAGDKDGIPALTNPPMVPADHQDAAYLKDDDRVIGFQIEGDPVAIPLNVLWWHEIVNLDADGFGLAITHCPLTGSSLGFDRVASGGAEFGVSGLLYLSNLILYDRNGVESLWPQMLRGARCGSRDGTDLPMVPILEMTWGGWKDLHPETTVVSKNTGFNRPYTDYPYGNYEEKDNPQVYYAGPVDKRRPAKERVLGIPIGTAGFAFPFGALDEMGPAAAIPLSFPGGSLVVFWDRGRQAAMAFSTVLGSDRLSFTVEDDRVIDLETGSVWNVEGRAVEGPLAGQSIPPVADAFVAYWFAWPLFYPDIELWTGA